MSLREYTPNLNDEPPQILPSSSSRDSIQKVKLSFEPAWLYSSSVIVDSLEAGQTVRNSSHRAYSFGMLLIVFSPYVYDCE